MSKVCRSILTSRLAPSRSTTPSRTSIKHFHTTQPSLANLAAFRVPEIKNEPNKHYQKGSPDRDALATALRDLQKNAPMHVPIVISGKNKKTDNISTQHNPSSHSEVVARYCNASTHDVHEAIEGALAAKPAWEALPYADRAAVFLKAADLISTKYRYEIMAATMLGQGKNAWQAEVKDTRTPAVYKR